MKINQLKFRMISVQCSPTQISVRNHEINKEAAGNFGFEKSHMKIIVVVVVFVVLVFVVGITYIRTSVKLVG